MKKMIKIKYCFCSGENVKNKVGSKAYFHTWYLVLLMLLEGSKGQHSGIKKEKMLVVPGCYCCCQLAVISWVFRLLINTASRSLDHNDHSVSYAFPQGQPPPNLSR